MRSLKKSRVTQLLLVLAIFGAGVSAVCWHFSFQTLAVFVGVFSSVSAVAISYWRLRVSVMHLMKKSVELRDSHSSLHGRVNSQLNSTNSAMRGQLKLLEKELHQLSNASDGKSRGAFESERIAMLGDRIDSLDERLLGQQALLHEILLSLDLNARR